MPHVSIIIPCFNKGEYITEAVGSALAQTYADIEIVIVNDGSNDGHTDRMLEGLTDPRIRIVSTPNRGVARARNEGIGVSRGKYILPLDADDRIDARYVSSAVKILDSCEEVGIVYCLGRFFDGKRGNWQLPPYSPEGILIDNMIFCSAFFRKKDWEKTSGYNPNMNHGYEDWDFWLSLVEMGLEVHRIPEALFDYRIKDTAARHLRTDVKTVDLDMRKQLVDNHRALYASPSTGRGKNFLRFCVRRVYALAIDSRWWTLARLMRRANVALSSLDRLSFGRPRAARAVRTGNA